MCGIVGVIANRPVASLVLEGLKRLEYRGYDSAGIATLSGATIERRRAQGKISNLDAKLQQEPLPGNIGIGHTRWATHGKPNETNAHPHATKRVAVVHNGIIENYKELRAELESKGCTFQSDTDTETIAHLLTLYIEEGMTPADATAKALKRLEGAFALALLFSGDEHLLIGARRGSPLAIGYGDGEMYLGSDALALAPLTNRITYLEEGDWAEIKRDSVVVHDASDAVVKRPIQQTSLSGAMIGKAGYRHFMLKEIFEQAGVIGDTLNSLVDPATGELQLPDLPFDWKDLSRITLIGCGTAHYAGVVAKYWFEQVAKLSVETDIASEFRYREGPMPKGGVMIVVSQSGETADTLAAIHYAKSQGQKILAIVNVLGSSMTRLADVVVPTLAGPEIGVASTKAFTTQLVVLAILALDCAMKRGALTKDEMAKHIKALREVPSDINAVVQQHEQIRELSQSLAEARDCIYLGRGLNYPIALEGALKLKEISYIHAEAYAAGELKHGPIALIDEDMPVVVLAPRDALFEKTASNIQEVMARGGKVIVFSHEEGVKSINPKPFWSMALPDVDSFVSPLLYAVPMQLLAYYTAMAKGTDIDQPRNLAKSVTVE
ncbi:MAG: glutamine--fructose-6-phosphate transaminase (isomerizing) [Alphaproteobacteria bacterium]|nr:glutamine--fructose-6-phosphate transaminase (isomerizing) [Alphaproteobacteria bacterium]